MGLKIVVVTLRSSSANLCAKYDDRRLFSYAPRKAWGLRAQVGEGQRERHTHTESEAGSKAYVSTKPKVGLRLTDSDIMT